MATTDRAQCVHCHEEVLPGFAVMPWFTKDEDNNVTARGVIHLRHILNALDALES